MQGRVRIDFSAGVANLQAALLGLAVAELGGLAIRAAVMPTRPRTPSTQNRSGTIPTGWRANGGTAGRVGCAGLRGETLDELVAAERGEVARLARELEARRQRALHLKRGFAAG